MFISKHEKEELQKKIEHLSTLVAQASDRAQKSEDKILELSMKLSSTQDIVIQQQLRTVEVIEEFHEIEGLGDEITEKITKFDSRLNGLEKFFSSRYDHYENVEKELKILQDTSRKANANVSDLESRIGEFIRTQGINSEKFKEQIKTLYNDQKIKNEKVFAVERLLEVTRAVLFALKKEVSNNKQSLLGLSKIAVIREEPVFVLDGGESPPEKPAVKTRKTRSTKGIKLGPLIRTPEAPWGLKKDGTPRKPSGFAARKIQKEKNEQPLPV